MERSGRGWREGRMRELDAMVGCGVTRCLRVLPSRPAVTIPSLFPVGTSANPVNDVPPVTGTAGETCTFEVTRATAASPVSSSAGLRPRSADCCVRRCPIGETCTVGGDWLFDGRGAAGWGGQGGNGRNVVKSLRGSSLMLAERLQRAGRALVARAGAYSGGREGLGGRVSQRQLAFPRDFRLLLPGESLVGARKATSALAVTRKPTAVRS